MDYTLENDYIRISASTHGGELHSIFDKKNGTELLWNADPKHWQYSSPILFPVVGKLKDDKCNILGKEYFMKNHGFARISEFVLSEKTSDSITFRLDYNEATLEVYTERLFPFGSQLYIKRKQSFSIFQG